MKFTVISAVLMMSIATVPAYAAGSTSQTGNAGVGIEGTEEGTTRVTSDTSTTDTSQTRGKGNGKGKGSKK